MGTTYNRDAVIVNVCNLVERFFQFSVLSLWPMHRVSISNHIFHIGLGKPRNKGWLHSSNGGRTLHHWGGGWFCSRCSYSSLLLEFVGLLRSRASWKIYMALVYCGSLSAWLAMHPEFTRETEQDPPLISARLIG